MQSPWPEEMNRRTVGQIATLHFAPTEGARRALLREGVAPERIWVTGNTVVDALQRAVEVVRRAPPAVPELPPELWINRKPMVLVTGHRRGDFRSGLESICNALAELASRFPDAEFVYPVHLNPNVREPVFRCLGGRSNVRLIEPVDYLSFLRLMDRAPTDTDGLQQRLTGRSPLDGQARAGHARHDRTARGYRRRSCALGGH